MINLRAMKKCYSGLPITRTLANSNLVRTRTKINFPWISVIYNCNFTLGNSNLPLTQSSFCFPSDHFYIILPSITRTMFWALKSPETTVYWRPKHWTLNFPFTCCMHIVYYARLMLFVTNLTWNSFTSQNSKTHALFKQVLLCYNLEVSFNFHLTFPQLNVIKMFTVQ